jgi:hypothetical protein
MTAGKRVPMLLSPVDGSEYSKLELDGMPFGTPARARAPSDFKQVRRSTESTVLPIPFFFIGILRSKTIVSRPVLCSIPVLDFYAPEIRKDATLPVC